MKIKKGKEKIYQDWLDKNNDGYGNACFLYADYWTELIEEQIKQKVSVTKDLLEKLSSEVDNKPGMGISGFMFGAVKSIMINCWEYGHLIEYYYTENATTKKQLERQLKLERILNDN